MARKRPTKRGDRAAMTLQRGVPAVSPEELEGLSKEDRAAERAKYAAVKIPTDQRAEKPTAYTPERAQYNRIQSMRKEGLAAVRGVAQGAADRQRKDFEKKNPDRFKTAQEIIPGARNLSNSQLSRAMGWHEEGGAEPANHPLQGTLTPEAMEGLPLGHLPASYAGSVHATVPAAGEHPHMVDVPSRWEDMKPHQQKRVLAAAADYGVTPESMKRSFSAQLQRGLIRDPDHLSFYEARGQNEAGTDLPRERMERSSRETGAPFHLTAATNAITSPQMSFVTTSKDRTYYPNAESAEAAIGYSRSGMTGKEYIEGHKGNYPHQGYPSNLGRAIDVATKVEGGMPLREAWTPGGRAGSGSGDKVRAYHNAWIDPKAPEGNFLVSDTHTGAGGMAPHLAGTEHETKYLSIAGIHALHDKVARDVMAEHGLSSVSRTQSLQWNQEKAEAKDQGTSAAMHGAKSVESMQPAPRNLNQQQHEVPGQQGLF